MKKFLFGLIALFLAFNASAVNVAAESASDIEDIGVVAGATEKKTKNKTKAGESYTKDELKQMACMIYCEAGNQCYAGKLAVGIVIKNRMESKRFPNTIKGVLTQPYQFTPARSGVYQRALSTYSKTGFKSGAQYKSCLKAAKDALSGNKTVKVNGKKRSMKGYYFFSRSLSGCRLQIQAHQFK